MSAIYFYTLLYIDDKFGSTGVNNLKGDFNSKINTYIKCCEVLSKSLKMHGGYPLKVLTNNAEKIAKCSPELDAIEINFKLSVPEKIKFYPAHFKWEVYKYISEQHSSSRDYHIVLDNDVVCINKITQDLLSCVRQEIPTYFNISSLHYPAYGRKVMIETKEHFMPKKSSTGLWAGGEYIGGTASFFKRLVLEIDTHLERYFETFNYFHHQGDEVLTSVAIETLLKKGEYIHDVGQFGGIGRYWSVPVKHEQKRLRAYKDYFLLHLPADKAFLKNLSKPEGFLNRYRIYLYLNFPANILRKVISMIKK